MQPKLKSSMFLYSIGYVTKNKAYDTRFIQALPVEAASATDGETAHNPVENILKGVDEQGNEYEVKATSTRDIECEWYPFDDNRVTPPDVMRGELVEIYRLGNSTRYFWRCMGMRNGLRTLEHVVHAYGAKPNAGGAGVDLSTCYTLAVSPLNGYINLQTTKANNEPFAYTVQINTKDGVVAITDDVGNFFELNSRDTRLQLKNVDNTYLKLEKQWIEMNADKYIQMTCGGSTYRMTPTTIDSKTTTYTNNSTTATIKATATLNIDAPQVNAKCVRWDWI